MKRKEFKTEIGGKTLTLEISDLAPQTNAAVLAKYGETIALVTVVALLAIVGILFPSVYNFAGGDAEWNTSGGSRPEPRRHPAATPRI